MAVETEQVKYRGKELISFNNKYRIFPSGKKKSKLSEEEKQHKFVNYPGKLKNNCITCGRSFEKVKRKVTYGKQLGIKRTNYCILCHKNSVKQTNEIRRNRWNNFKKLWILHQDGKCNFCDYSDLSCISVFDFHHKSDEVKEFSLSVLTGFGYNLTNKKLFVKEARKCFVVCANCHRKIGRGVIND